MNRLFPLIKILSQKSTSAVRTSVCINKVCTHMVGVWESSSGRFRQQAFQLVKCFLTFTRPFLTSYVFLSILRHGCLREVWIESTIIEHTPTQWILLYYCSNIFGGVHLFYHLNLVRVYLDSRLFHNNPRYLISGCLTAHLLIFIFKPDFLSLSNISVK